MICLVSQIPLESIDGFLSFVIIFHYWFLFIGFLLFTTCIQYTQKTHMVIGSCISQPLISSKSFNLVAYLMLTNRGFPNTLLLVDLTPLTSNDIFQIWDLDSDELLQLIVIPLQVNHSGMAFPCPFADSLDPLDHFLSFDVSQTIPKNM